MTKGERKGFHIVCRNNVTYGRQNLGNVGKLKAWRPIPKCYDLEVFCDNPSRMFFALAQKTFSV